MIWVSKHSNLDYTDCSVLCTPTILPAIRISWDKNPTFMLISGRAPRSFIHPCASTGGLRPFDTVIIIIRKGKNRVNYTNSAIRLKSNDSEESLLFYTVPVTISVPMPGFVIRMPVKTHSPSHAQDLAHLPFVHASFHRWFSSNGL